MNAIIENFAMLNGKTIKNVSAEIDGAWLDVVITTTCGHEYVLAVEGEFGFNETTTEETGK